MAHVVNAAAEEILDQEFPVLDHGFVRLVDYLGGDTRIVQAARVSYGSGTKTVREDKILIDYLLGHDHTSPFEQVVFTFHLKMPIFVARQWVRHRTARLNEISGRYSVMKEEFYVPDDEHVHLQAKDNRQGRDETTPAPPEVRAQVRETMREHHKQVYEHYQDMIGQDISRELARINLPLSLYTEFYWQMDLHNLLHFLALRLDDHAQLEIRAYAKVLAQIVKAVTPWTWEAFERHRLRSKRLGDDEIAAVRNLLAGRETGLSKFKETELRKKLGLEPAPAESQKKPEKGAGG
jgi:thymidylate synthase (FAD)